MGIAREPDFIIGPDVRAGRLIPILRQYEPPPLALDARMGGFIETATT